MSIERLMASTEAAKKQGYKNPFTGEVKISFVENQIPEGMLQRFREFIRFPVKLTPEQTQLEWDKMVREEAEELWGPGSDED